MVIAARLVGPTRVERVQLAVDTASTWTVLRPTALERLGYRLAETQGRVAIVTGSRIEAARLLRISELQALAQSWHNVAVLAHQLPVQIRVDGVLGLNQLREHRLTINFPARTISLQ